MAQEVNERASMARVQTPVEIKLDISADNDNELDIFEFK
jgi:hypothetical protein